MKEPAPSTSAAPCSLYAPIPISTTDSGWRWCTLPILGRIIEKTGDHWHDPQARWEKLTRQVAHDVQD